MFFCEHILPWGNTLTTLHTEQNWTEHQNIQHLSISLRMWTWSSAVAGTLICQRDLASSPSRFRRGATAPPVPFSNYDNVKRNIWTQNPCPLSPNMVPSLPGPSNLFHIREPIYAFSGCVAGEITLAWGERRTLCSRTKARRGSQTVS